MPCLFEFVRMWSIYTIKRLAFIANGVVMPTVSQEIFVPQLIVRGLPFSEKTT